MIFCIGRLLVKRYLITIILSVIVMQFVVVTRGYACFNRSVSREYKVFFNALNTATLVPLLGGLATFGVFCVKERKLRKDFKDIRKAVSDAVSQDELEKVVQSFIQNYAVNPLTSAELNNTLLNKALNQRLKRYKFWKIISGIAGFSALTIYLFTCCCCCYCINCDGECKYRSEVCWSKCFGRRDYFYKAVIREKGLE